MVTADIRLRSSRPQWAGLLELFAAVGTALALTAVLQAQDARAPYDPGTRVMQPRIFAEGSISTDLDESGGAFSPDGKDFYFTVLAPYTTAPRFGIICVSHFKDGRWQTPKTASFSGQYLDLAPRLSAGGNKLYFTSIRPAPINQESSQSVDASVSANGDMYFASDRDDPTHHQHIFHSRLVDGKFQAPEKLGPEINSEFTESAPAISPDGKVLIFASNAAEDPEHRRPQDLIAGGKPYPRQDLYVSVNRNGRWTPARHLEHGINSFAEEVYPSFSPDGKFLFWGSERSSFDIPTRPLKRAAVEKLWPGILNGRGNIYFISLEALEVEK
jgi:hypothetical protein